MTEETAKIVQQIGSGTESSRANISPSDSCETLTSGVFATVTGTLCIFAAGVVINGCVFAIFTVAGGGAAGSGKMLIRAVSFFGPACALEPG